jgi:PAS domain S-box-containing protein
MKEGGKPLDDPVMRSGEADREDQNKPYAKLAKDISNADSPEPAIGAVLENIIMELGGSAAFLAPIEEGEYVVRYLRGDPIGSKHHLEEVCRHFVSEQGCSGLQDEAAGGQRFLLVHVRNSGLKSAILGAVTSGTSDDPAPALGALERYAGLMSLAMMYRSVWERNKDLEVSFSRIKKSTEQEHLLFSTILDSLPVGVVLADREAQVTETNLMARLMLFGESSMLYQSPKLEKVPAWNHQTGDPLQKEDWPLFRTIALGRTIIGDIIDLVQPGGVNITLTVSSAPIIDVQWQVLGGVMVLQDITSIKEAEKELVQNAKELTRSNAELQQFAYVASHDLQEPLRMVTSYLGLLEKRYGDQLDPKAQEFIDYALQGSERMKQLINGLLEYSRVNSRGVRFAPLEMGQVINEVMLALKASIDENKAIIVAAQLPTILADRRQMAQLLQNLIGNAIKFHGPQPPRVEISAREDGREWIFSVHDNGIGIDPKYHSRIFEVFQRLHTVSEFPGTGIGLAICKKIVEQHGGRIWVESAEENGSTFFFALPKVGTD